MTWPTRAALAAVRMRWVPMTLVRAAVKGLASMSETCLQAAAWKTMCGWNSVKMLRRRAGSQMSPTMRRRSDGRVTWKVCIEIEEAVLGDVEQEELFERRGRRARGRGRSRWSRPRR